MTWPEDDWKYARSRQQHFGEAELDVIRNAFLAGRKVRDVARELRCSSRVIYTRYEQLRGGLTRSSPKAKPSRVIRAKPRQKTELPDRFYRSSFEPA